MTRKILGSALLLLLTFVAVGALGFTGARAGKKLYYIAAQHKWLTANATVTSEGTISRTLKYGRQQWAPSWTYTYAVNGRAYRADSTSINSGYSVNWYEYEPAAARDSSSRPVGSTVHAYYDPGNPSHSVLDEATFDLEDAINAAIFILVLARMMDFWRSGQRGAMGQSQ
jgi:hypothetical protein